MTKWDKNRKISLREKYILLKYKKAVLIFPTNKLYLWDAQIEFSS